MAPSTLALTECEKCGKTVKASDSNHFVYIPIEQQIVKSVNDHFDEIKTYRMCSDGNNNNITDMHDSILYKRIQDKYKNTKVLALAVNTDGAVVHKSSGKSLWAIHSFKTILIQMDVICKKTY